MVDVSPYKDTVSFLIKSFLNQALTGLRLARAWFYEITFNVQVCVCVCMCVCMHVCVCVHPRSHK